MLQRLLQLTKNYSLLVFGPRGVGKSTLVEVTFDAHSTVFVNLLDPEEERRFAREPNELVALVEALPDAITHVVIDEIQKVPKLLDVVHLLLESKCSQKYFVMTGSSARKLKMAGVNLLAGRAFVYHLYPFSFLELGEQFSLAKALRFGLLPKLETFSSDQDKQKFLQAYTTTYLKEEVWAEQLVRKLEPFRQFLEVAAQSNGKIINYSKISRDVGVDDKTVKNYFSILEDTLLGFMLNPYVTSFRKRLKTAQKFYFFDVGVARALARMLGQEPQPSTSYYGDLFEAFVIVECLKLASYYDSEYKFSYLMTGAGVEIDLVVERPGKPLLLIEIKSTKQVNQETLGNLQAVARDIPNCEAVCFSSEPRAKKIGQVIVYPWAQGVKEFFAK